MLEQQNHVITPKLGCRMNNVILWFSASFWIQHISIPLYYLINMAIKMHENLPTSYNVFCHKFLCFLVPLRICLKHNNLLLCLTETEKENLVLVHTWTKNSTCWDPLRNLQLSSIALPFLWHKWVHCQCWHLSTCLKRVWKSIKKNLLQFGAGKDLWTMNCNLFFLFCIILIYSMFKLLLL